MRPKPWPCQSGGQSLAIVNLGRPAGSLAWARATHGQLSGLHEIDRIRSQNLAARTEATIR